MTLNLALRKIVSTDDVLYIAFNQDHGCFSVGTELGFRIYNCDPFRETFRRNFPNGGIGIVEMLFRCNILALVGGGKTPCFPTNRVKLWDDHTMQVIGDLSFKDPVHAVRLRRDKVVVATGTMVYVYSFDKLELQQRYNTFDNPLGVFALSPSTSRCVLVCPALQAGVARIEDLTDDKGGFLNAHESPLSMLAISSDGTLVATASEKGTLIRVFDAVTNQRKKEFRRGSEAVVIYSLSFSVDAKFIACRGRPRRPTARACSRRSPACRHTLPVNGATRGTRGWSAPPCAPSASTLIRYWWCAPTGNFYCCSSSQAEASSPRPGSSLSRRSSPDPRARCGRGAP
eukprot:TRINITY_DN15646_c0_g1_i1.p2 TRINITY_DN15646_c0_g1~~TRINITY_DN15646_c0_g1_i1.p2  ORF type:complete len:343 (+),score=71.96 TRINITY_DN15646_c0_g1_i1:113-1141(+)